MANVEERLERIRRALIELGHKNYGPEVELDAKDDLLGAVEKGVNGLIMDLQTLDMANQEKAALVELQTQELDDQREQLAAQQAELEHKLTTIHEQAEAIRELSTPILDVWEDIVALPVVGFIDSVRCMELMTMLLDEIVAKQTKCVIIDITGVEVVDTKTADYLLKVVRASSLLGVRCVLTGLRPTVAQTMVEIGADMREVRTLRNLREGLKDSIIYLQQTGQRRQGILKATSVVV